MPARTVPALSLIRKSSARSSYSPGEASIPRTEILEIRLKRISGPARLIGAAGAGTAIILQGGFLLVLDTVNGTRLSAAPVVGAPGPAAQQM